MGVLLVLIATVSANEAAATNLHEHVVLAQLLGLLLFLGELFGSKQKRLSAYKNNG